MEIKVTGNEPRKRVNLKTSTKGVFTYDITVELFDKSNEEVVKEVMDLKEKVEKNLPPLPLA